MTLFNKPEDLLLLTLRGVHAAVRCELRNPQHSPSAHGHFQGVGWGGVGWVVTVHTVEPIVLKRRERREVKCFRK